jgi:hypothetical protein|tara:strand:+ start:531 stop:746 length:216 start_codon:yes stop_codon:yes gene_type:complete
MSCQHCNKDNSEGWFYCRTCGKRANKPLFSPAIIIREAGFATAIRKDQIDFQVTTMGEDIESKGGEIRGNV